MESVMPIAARVTVFIKWFLVVCLVIALSAMASRVRTGEAEVQTTGTPLALTPETTVQDIAEASGMPPPMLGKALNLQGPDDLSRSLKDLGITPAEARERIRAAKALASEHASKNWRMIVAKFILWAIFLTIVYLLLRRRRVTPKVRLALLALSVAIFGIVFGSSQSPMGTVKDAIVLWGRYHVIFFPRMIALALFLLGVLLANKFICGWGCQFGVLQDLLFRLNRDRRDRKGIIPQAKPPFVVSNAVRIAFFVVFVIAALAWATDLIEPLDPFKAYNPASIALLGGAFLALVLAASVFIYRPWCHFLCPFGLVGWVAESAARACPSTAMGAILKQDRTIPDCFSCGVCLMICPTQSITLSAGQRAAPPPGKFDAKSANTED